MFQFWYLTHDGDLYQDHNHVCEADGSLMQLGACPSGYWQYREVGTKTVKTMDDA